ncbi:MAG: histidine kinase [Armatimonadetes bacterium]|nr:histidine kinase [Armatimonadota bacterium]
MSEFLRLLRSRDLPTADERGSGNDAAESQAEVRLAIYDSPMAGPRVVSLRGQEFHEFVGELAARTYHFSREQGGRIPYVVIREVIENLIHAYFEGAVISILDDGNTIRISDQGPGIADREKALLPGFTTATGIKGVGSGLPVAREQLEFLGGAIAIDDNLGRGAVITLSVGTAPAKGAPPSTQAAAAPPELSPRQKKVLLLIAELGSAGPSAIAKELGISQSTAYRELQLVEDLRLVSTKRQGKRTLTEEGVAALGDVFKP